MVTTDTLFDWTPDSMLEVSLPDPDAFLKVKETLTRMGIASRKQDGEQRKLYQSCHILHKKGNYFIVHYKELFILDNKDSTLTVSDIARRNLIAVLLEQWGLLTIKDKTKVKEQANLSQLKIISHTEKSNWELIPKYQIGVKKT